MAGKDMVELVVPRGTSAGLEVRKVRVLLDGKPVPGVQGVDLHLPQDQDDVILATLTVQVSLRIADIEDDAADELRRVLGGLAAGGPIR